MTTQELLRKRYKVIAPYPFNSWNVGHIIEFKSNEDTRPMCETPIYAAFEGDPNFCQHNFPSSEFDEYPNIFDPLPWWKERKLEDMPEYAMIDIDIEDKGKCFNINGWYSYVTASGETSVGFMDSEGNTIGAHAVKPISEADYNTYLQTTNQNNG